MTRKEVINELHVIREYCKLIFDNKYPVALDYAEEYLKSAKAIKEVIELKEEDFYDDLPFWMKEEDPNV